MFSYESWMSITSKYFLDSHQHDRVGYIAIAQIFLADD